MLKLRSNQALAGLKHIVATLALQNNELKPIPTSQLIHPRESVLPPDQMSSIESATFITTRQITIDQKGKATKLWRSAFISASLFGACLEIMDFPIFVIPNVAARMINEHVVMDSSPLLTPTIYASEDSAKVDSAGTTRIADGTAHVGRRRRLDSKYSEAWHGIDEIT